jgi:hypothetical protein
MEPINYKLDVQSPFDSAIKGYQAGVGMRNTELELQQKQAALAQQQQQRQVINGLINNPNAGAQEYANAALLVPTMREQLKQSWDTKNTAQQQNLLSDLSQWSAAIQNNKPEVAVASILSRADTIESATGGQTQESKNLRVQADIIKEHPQFGNFMIKSMLMAHPEGEKVVNSIAKLGAERRAEELQAGLIVEGKAKGSKAATEAEVAEATAEDLKAKPAIENKIAELDVQIKQANSETQRGQLQLEREKLVLEQSKLAATGGQSQQSELESVEQAISTVGKLMNDPLLKSSIGIGSAIGKVLGYIPGTENKDYRANVATMKAQLFLPAVAALKAAGGAGALSDAEGRKLDAAVSNLDTDMSPQAFKNNLGVIQALMKKQQQKILANPKLPTSGGGFVANHPTLGEVREGDINRLLKQHPGATREQVLQFLQSQGVK